jgi:hypothetical protein
MHYARFRRHGDPLHRERELVKGPPEIRFWAKVKVGEAHECWPWTASVFKDRNGYGKFQAGQGIGKTNVVYAHRSSYELASGPIPVGMDVLHSCDNPPCVNPAHLHLGTAADNAREMVERGRDQWSNGTRGAVQPCGTSAGYSTHRRRGEPPCDACRAAKRDYDRQWRLDERVGQ